MPDREKLSRQSKSAILFGHNCAACPYYTEDDCNNELMRDALALLREQEPQEPHYCEADDSWSCGNCGETVGYGEYNPLGPVRNKYCKECGKRVKWI